MTDQNVCLFVLSIHSIFQKVTDQVLNVAITDILNIPIVVTEDQIVVMEQMRLDAVSSYALIFYFDAGKMQSNTLIPRLLLL